MNTIQRYQINLGINRKALTIAKNKKFEFCSHCGGKKQITKIKYIFYNETTGIINEIRFFINCYCSNGNSAYIRSGHIRSHYDLYILYPDDILWRVSEPGQNKKEILEIAGEI